MREKPRYKHKKVDRDIFLGHYGDYDLYVYTYPDKTIAVPFYKKSDDTMVLTGRYTLQSKEYNGIVHECIQRALGVGCKKDPLWDLR